MSNKLSIVLITAIVFLVVVASLLLLKQRSIETSETPDQETSIPQIEPEVWYSSDPVKKHVAEDQSFVEWEVKGQFTGPIKKNPDSLQGTFIIDGDASGTKFNIWIGSTTGDVLMAKTAIADGDTRTEEWRITPSSDVVKLVLPNQEATLFFEWRKELDPKLSKYKIIEEFWSKVNDSIKRQGKLDESQSSPPVNLYTIKMKYE